MNAETITATPEQTFDGRAVSAGGKTICTGCKRTVRSGDAVGVYAYRTADAVRWDVARVSCGECRLAAIPHPTLGADELALHARLGVTSDTATQNSQLVLCGCESVARSPPGEGSQP